MNIQDIRQRILFELPIKELLSACSTDKLSRIICSSYNFWKDKFDQAGLIIINRRENVEAWILEYNFSKICKNRTNEIIGILQDPEFINSNSELTIRIKGNNDINILNIPGINFTEVSSELLSTLIDEKNHPSQTVILNYITYNVSIIFYEVDDYEITIYADHVTFTSRLVYHISEQSLSHIIYYSQYNMLYSKLVNVPHNYGIGVYLDDSHQIIL